MFEIKIDRSFWDDVIFHRRRFAIVEEKHIFQEEEKVKFVLDQEHFILAEVSYVNEEKRGLQDNFSVFSFLVENIIFGGED